MKHLPASPDVSHLKKQAKQLLRDARAGEPNGLQRFAEALPAVRGMQLAALAQRELQLHDAQSVLAREYGFRSWPELTAYAEWKRTDRTGRLQQWLDWVYEGNAGARRLAVRLWREEPELFADDLWLACATGDDATVAASLSNDAGSANRPGGPLGMPPLLAVTHSRLILEDAFEPRLLACAKLLIESGADVDSSWIHPQWPDAPQSALYGAAGRTHSVAMTRLLLEAGANPDDNESLYHSVESRDPTCTRLLLDAGARVVGTNAIGRVLDYDKPDLLRLLLDHGGDARERPWIHHAILRGRSIEHIRILIDAGADPRATDHQGVSLYRWARTFGRDDVAALFREAGVEETLSVEEEFVAACTRADEAAARDILRAAPDIFSRLTETQVQAMPGLAALGEARAVRTMLAVGWPREVKTAWSATALNLAVYRGDAEMVGLLLDHGADWRTPHGFGNNVVGTLSHASQAEDIEDPAPRDYAGCARALIAHGMPLPDEERYVFSAEVTEVFREAGSGKGEAGAPGGS